MFLGIGTSIGELLTSFRTFNDVTNGLRKDLEFLTLEEFPSIGNAILSVTETVEGWFSSNEKASDGLTKLRRETSETTESVKELEKTLPNVTEEAEDNSDAVTRLAIRLAELNKNGVSLKSVIESVGKGFDLTTLKVGNATDGFREITGAITNVGTASGEASSKLKENFDETVTESERFRLETASLNVELEKLASQERQKIFEVEADLKVAEIEQGTKRIEEAFKTIRTGIESTQEGLSALTGGLLDAQGSNRTLIRELIRAEEKRREKAFKLAEEREKAELKLIKAQTSFFNSGESLIQVNADGLKAHLEALFLEILEEASFQINANGQVFLAALPQAV